MVRNDEIGQLVNAFNAMAKTIAHERERLEQQVQERTASQETSRRAALSLMQDAQAQRQRVEQTAAQLAVSEKTVRLRADWAQGLQKAGEELAACKTVAEVARVAAQAPMMHLGARMAWVSAPRNGGGMVPLACSSPDIQHAAETCECPLAVFGCGLKRIVPDSGAQPPYDTCRNAAQAGNFRSCGTWPIQEGNGTRLGTLTIRCPELGEASRVVAAGTLIDVFCRQVGYAWDRLLIEAELANAREAAEAANRAKSDFLASMSHELRTPLNSILGFSEVLQDQTFGPLNPKQARYTDNVLTAGRHLLSLINDILDLSKVEAGKMELEISPVPVKALLGDALLMVRERALKHDLALTLEAPDDVVVSADERKLKQILFNLLSNAIKFTPAGGQIRVGATLTNAENGSRKSELGTMLPSGLPVPRSDFPVPRSELLISVSDTGIGIKPEDRVRLFQPFQQLDSSYTRKQEGTGLGLALARRFVELHGGRIWVESEGEGRGSTFRFAIPLTPAGSPAPAVTRVEWTAEFSVGVKVLDAQHQRLFGMLNALLAARVARAGEDLVSRILREVVQYAVEHFQEEERLMSQQEYPRFEEHVRQHRAFAARIAELTAAVKDGDRDVAGTLSEYLKHWLTHHILSEDLKYRPFFAEKGVA